MLRSFERQASWKYLSGRNGGFLSLSALFSLAGIAIGVAALIVASAFLNGQRDALLDAIQGRSPHVTLTVVEPPPPSPVCTPETDALNIALGILETCIVPPSALKGFTAKDPLILALLDRAEVKAGYFEVAGQGMVVLPSSGAVSGTYIRGLSPEAIEQRLVGHPAAYALTGTMELARGEAALGYGVVASLNPDGKASLALLGHTLDLVSPDGAITVIGWTPRRRDVKVNIVFGGFAERNETYLPLDSAATFLGFEPGRFNNLQLFLHDADEAAAFARGLEAEWGEIATTERSFRSSTWEDRNQALVSTLGIQRVVLILVLALIVVVAAFNILASQVMLVREKRRGIALLRTLGVGQGSVARIFIGMGLFLALAGCGLGLCIGLSVVLNFDTIIGAFAGVPALAGAADFLGSVQVTLSPNDSLLAVGLALAITVLATLYPAWQAARTEPAEVLRYV
ncbi:MAG: hypothetical protein CMF26_06405 [Kiloniella sp.]|nr:hypothetical protein [Kiloniella sp.]